MISSKEEPAAFAPDSPRRRGYGEPRKLAVIYARTSSDANDDDRDIDSTRSIARQFTEPR